ncbi:MAG: Glycerophosphoryl diester phosphodiesterase [Nitrospira sp.]|nr:MAG: Glycerophosphoryl diester phosphodiesterase [Nitrospira sp.]
MILRIGHRGAGGHAPENTLAAIERGIALHTHLVEFDVRATRDGQLVLLHDATLGRTTNGHGPIAHHLWSDVKRLTTSDGQPLPLLADALRAALGRTGVMIEIKAEGTAKQICRTVREIQFSGPVIYASFLHDELLAVRREEPRAQTLALIEAVLVNRTAFAKDAQATHAGVAFEILTPSFLKALHDRSLRVFVYTVNEPADIQTAKAMGVDGIISDYPDRLL